MPWQWDYENYYFTKEQREMIGFFYPEDIEAIIQLHIWEVEKNNEDIENQSNNPDNNNNRSNSKLPPPHHGWNQGKSFNPNMFINP